jgi:actin
MDEPQLTVVVLDNGTSTLKAGFSGEDAPRCEVLSVVGRSRHPGATGLMHGINTDIFVGDVAREKRGLLEIQRPLKHGLVTDWDAMQHLWHHVFYDDLKIACEEHPIIVTEAADNSRQDREKTVEILFECFNAPAVVIQNASVLTLFSTGRSSGLVVDSGASRTSIGPVWEGYGLPHFSRRLNFGGDDVTSLLFGKLRGDGYPFSTESDREEVEKIKQEHCYVSMNLDKESAYCRESRSIERWHKLPDGQEVYLNDHRFATPEALFNPAMFGEVGKGSPGIHEVINATIQMCDPTVQAEMYSAIVLGGGNTLFPKLDERLQREVSDMSPKGTAVRAVAFPDRKYAAWLGGSVVGSLKTFPCMWVSKNEYDDYGASIIHRKCS